MCLGAALSAQVVYVTVARPNRPLLQLLLQRRRLLQTLFLNGSMLARRAAPHAAAASAASATTNSSAAATAGTTAAVGAPPPPPPLLLPPPLARLPRNPRLSAEFELAQLRVDAAAERNSAASRVPGTAAAAAARSSTQAHVEAALGKRASGGQQGSRRVGVGQDAPWLTGAHVDQAVLLSPADVRAHTEDPPKNHIATSKTRVPKREQCACAVLRRVAPTRLPHISSLFSYFCL
jgi:hypothetical protein